MSYVAELEPQLECPMVKHLQAVGTEVTVRYQPGDPTMAIVKDNVGRSYASLTMVLIGAGLLAMIGLAVLLAPVRKDRRFSDTDPTIEPPPPPSSSP